MQPNPFEKYNNQSDVIDVSKFLAQQQALNGKQKAAPKAKGNFLTHLLPTIGGTGGGVAGGAAGGALAGSAILPGVGTAIGGLAGALLGGFAGGAGGKAVENKVEGQALGNGVVGQGLEQGVLSAGPLKLLKGASAGVKAATVGGKSLADALTSAGDAAVAPGLLSKGANLVAGKGSQMEARAGGFGIGEKAAGQQPLGFYDSAKIAQNLKAEGIKAGSPEARLKQVEDALATRGKQIDVHLADNNATLGDAQKQTIADQFIKAIENQPGVDDLARKQAENLAQNFMKQTTDLKSLVNFRRGLDKQAINFNQNPDAALAAKQLAARTLRDTLSEHTNKLAPGLKQLNKSYSNLINAKDYLVGGSKVVSDQSQSASGGIIGRLIANDTAQSAKSKTGAQLQKLATGAPAEPFGVKAVAGRTLPIGLASAAASSAQPVNMTSASQMSDPSMMNPSSSIDGSYQNTGDLSSALMPAQQQSQSPYSQENLVADIQRDPKNADKYISTYKSLSDIFAGQAPAKLNATQQQQSFNAQSGLQALQKIADTLQTNPNAAKLSSLPGGSITANLTGTGEYKAAINNAVDVIGRLRSGGAIGQQEQKNFLALLPQAGDNSTTINYKLQQLASVFQNFANPQPAAATDLTGALLASGQYQ